MNIIATTDLKTVINLTPTIRIGDLIRFIDGLSALRILRENVSVVHSHSSSIEDFTSGGTLVGTILKSRPTVIRNDIKGMLLKSGELVLFRTELSSVNLEVSGRSGNIDVKDIPLFCKGKLGLSDIRSGKVKNENEVSVTNASFDNPAALINIPTNAIRLFNLTAQSTYVNNELTHSTIVEFREILK